MQEDNNQNNINTIQQPQQPKQQPQQQPEHAHKKDYLLPALFFIALFFGFFVLVTMQKLTGGYVYKDDNAVKVITPTVPASSSDSVKTKETSLSDTLKQDDQKTPEAVTDELLMEIDKTVNTDTDSILDEKALDDL